MIHRPRMFCWALLTAFGCGIFSDPIIADENAAFQSVDAWKAKLVDADVQVRRSAAIASRSADKALQVELLPVFIELLEKEKDGQVRLAVLDTITDMGASASPAVSALVETLRTEYGGKRNEELHQDYRSALALAAIGRPAVDGLRSLLTEEADNVRAEAAMALGRIGPPARAGIPDLIVLLSDHNSRVRREASQALGGIGDAALEPLLSAVEDGSDKARAGAILALGWLSTEDGRAIDAVRQGMHAAVPQVRAAAVRSLAGLHLPGDELRGILVESLGHDDERVRLAAVNTLVNRQELLNQIEPELSTLLTAQHEGVAWHAAFLLQRLGPKVIPSFVAALRHPKSRIDQIGRALALIGRPAVPDLSVALNAPNPRVRQGAALALGQILPLSDDTVRKLAAGLDDPDKNVQVACLTAIGHLGSRARAAVPAVRTKLQDDSAKLRAQAIGILFDAAPRDDRLIDDLTAMISDADTEVQRRAIDAIRSSGPLGRRALPAVIDALKSPHSDVRMAAAEMIGNHGQAAAQAVPELTGLLDAAPYELRLVVIQTLGQLGATAEPAFGKLTQFLDDENVEVRAATVQTVGSLDLPSNQLRPYLARAIQDQQADVRRQGLRAIRRLGEQGTVFLPDLILLVANEEQSRFVKRTLDRYERYAIDPQAIPELIGLLEHEHDEVKLLAIRFLGLAGPSAKDALVILQPLCDDMNAEIRAAAAASIIRINNDPASASQESTTQDGRPRP